mmetsp:Transcript_53767/g.163277  ORF Transcript_53767/g.163277 Transcript_53767/m.163277 type:complete len:271 (+) Transcript_53767:975-1787(+)
MASWPALTFDVASLLVPAFFQPKPEIGFTMTAATSLARRRRSSREAAHWSFRMRQSPAKRSFPAPCITPSHQPWYAPWNTAVTLRCVWNRAWYTALMTASVPLMWNETSSLRKILSNISTFSATMGCTGPRQGPRVLASSCPAARNSFVLVYPKQLTPYEPDTSRNFSPDVSVSSMPSELSTTVIGSRASLTTCCQIGYMLSKPEALKRRSEKCLRKNFCVSAAFGHRAFQEASSRAKPASRLAATSSGGASARKNSLRVRYRETTSRET